jgi:hypothetical protein
MPQTDPSFEAYNCQLKIDELHKIIKKYQRELIGYIGLKNQPTDSLLNVLNPNRMNEYVQPNIDRLTALIVPLEQEIIVLEQTIYQTEKEVNGYNVQRKKYYKYYVINDNDDNRHDVAEVIIKSYDDESTRITYYFPKYNLEVTTMCIDLNELKSMEYNDPTNNGELSPARFEKLLLNNYGSWTIGKIINVDYTTVTIKVNNENIKYQDHRIYNFSYEFPGIKYIRNNYRPDTDITGMHVAIEYYTPEELILFQYNHKIKHVLLLDERLYRILVTDRL